MKMVYEKKTLEDLKIGDFSLFPKTISASDIMLFTGTTGDLSPVYLNDEFGATTCFGVRVAPPMLVAGMLVGAIFRLVSPDAYPISREFRTIKPFFVGDTLTARAEVAAIDSEAQQVTVRLTAYNNAGEVVLEGTSVESMNLRK